MEQRFDPGAVAGMGSAHDREAATDQNKPEQQIQDENSRGKAHGGKNQWRRTSQAPRSACTQRKQQGANNVPALHMAGGNEQRETG
jgi:hypothetical protein